MPLLSSALANARSFCATENSQPVLPLCGFTQLSGESGSALRELSPIRRHLGLLRIAIPQQDQQLACGEPGAGLRALRPPREPTLREALRTQPEALAIIEQNLEGGSRAVAEDIQGAAERIVTEHLAAHGREPIDALAKIDGLGGEKDTA